MGSSRSDDFDTIPRFIGKGAMTTDGTNFQATVARLFKDAAFITDVGIHLISVGPGRCETQLVLMPKHFQQDECVHPGAMATMAEHTAIAALTTLLSPKEHASTVEFKINFLFPAQGKCLRCRSQVLKPGGKIVSVESEVYILGGDMTRLVAKALCTLVVSP
jgi:uncharacterized protein (TIGR00369 family)